MPKLLFLLFLLAMNPFRIQAQIFQYITMEDGLSSRRVFSIRQDEQGYTWILTHKGIDRYDGKRFTFYPLLKEGIPVYAYPNQNMLRTGTDKTLWEIGEDGTAFRYNELKDSFKLAFDLKKSYPETGNSPVSTAHFDDDGKIWFCTGQKQFVYQTTDGKSYPVENSIPESIVSITQAGPNRYFMASERNLYAARLAGNRLEGIEKIQIAGINYFDFIYCHKASGCLVINSLLKKSILYNLQDKSTEDLSNLLKDININNIIPDRNNPNELLMATDGGGVLRLNITEKKISQFLQEERTSLNKMNGNIVKDIFMDRSNRIWTAVYPIGITVYSKKYPSYTWFTHTTDSDNSLSNNCVNNIMEDKDGDIWFATNNGISCFLNSRKKWVTYCTDEKQPQYKNHIFTSLCEIPSGEILAGGYMSGIYVINKRTGEAILYQQSKNSKGDETPDKYIRSILRDPDNTIWTGGFYSLKSYNAKSGKKQEYTTPYPITHLAACDTSRLWIGTTNGVYVLDRKKQSIYPFETAENFGMINMVYTTKEKTFVGTYENGLIVIDNATSRFVRYHSGNSGLRTNNIYSIAPGRKGTLMLGTENGISIYDIKNRHFSNWTKEQGLMTANFNPNAIVHTQKGNVILGSDKGFVMVADSIKLPSEIKNRMVLSDLNIMYRAVHPQEKNSPLTQILDETSRIDLKYNQNTFSLNVSSINYDTQESIYYSWKLEGFYDSWSAPTKSGLIRYTNLSPGNYRLKIRAVFLDNQKIIGERQLQIIVERPFWLTFWAFIIYACILIIAMYAVMKYLNIRRERKISEDKITFFTQAAHDIRTPLTLIKAPLDEILEKEELSGKGLENVRLAMQGTDTLTELADNLINFQKEELYTTDIVTSEYDLNRYLQNYIYQFDSYARQKEITLSYEPLPQSLTVDIDTQKMDSILRNLISNAFKYTSKGGSVTIKAETGKNTWTVAISDTGIGIPKEDQKKLFKYLFRGNNAANQSKSGAGIGLLLTYKLIEKHEGKISFESAENAGTTFKLTFPVRSKHFRRRQQQAVQQTAAPACEKEKKEPTEYLPAQTSSASAEAPCILVVEDNDSLRQFIMQNLSDIYLTEGAGNGKEGIEKVQAHQPDLIISDIMMPVMDGRKMCRMLKDNMETSHIPVILLTALSGNDQILLGLETRADQYLTKPFDIKILKATIHNLLENRRLIRQQFQQAITALPSDGRRIELPNSLDNEFIEHVTRIVKENLGKELNVDILCAAMNMSRTSFYNKIKALIGIAPAEFIRNIRMQEAALLLKSRRYTVAEVSDKMGFADPKYFTDTFKKFYGVPPSTYMKN